MVTLSLLNYQPDSHFLMQSASENGAHQKVRELSTYPVCRYACFPATKSPVAIGSGTYTMGTVAATVWFASTAQVRDCE